jgi:hypothetical protein
MSITALSLAGFELLFLVSRAGGVHFHDDGVSAWRAWKGPAMPGVCRLGDRAKAPVDVHGYPACPHPRDRSVDLGVVERVREDPPGKERQRQTVASA